MSYFLNQLDQAQKCLPIGLPQAIGADLLMTLLIWQQFTARYKVGSKQIADQCASQSRIMADMPIATPIPFSAETLFDACQWQQGDAGQAIHKSLSTLCQQQPWLDRIFRPERFAPNAPWAPLFANTRIWNEIMRLLGSIPASPLLPPETVFRQAMAHLLPRLRFHPGNAPANTAKLLASLLKPWRYGTTPQRYDNTPILHAWRVSQQQGKHPYLHWLTAAEMAAKQYSLALADYAPPRLAVQTGQAPSGSGGGNACHHTKPTPTTQGEPDVRPGPNPPSNAK